MSKTVLSLKNVNKSFCQGDQVFKVLDDINLTINQGEMIAIIGPSGCGKTTLLQIAGLIDKADSGEIIIDNQNIKDARDGVITEIRCKKLGFVYQFHNLLKDFTLEENVAMPLILQNKKKADALKLARTLLDQVGLSHRASHYPSEVSGGEQQRAAIARAIIHKPKIILADEPTGNLDPDTAEQVFLLLKDIIREHNLASIIVTHNVELSERLNRRVTIHHGKIALL